MTNYTGTQRATDRLYWKREKMTGTERIYFGTAVGFPASGSSVAGFSLKGARWHHAPAAANTVG